MSSNEQNGPGKNKLTDGLGSGFWIVWDFVKIVAIALIIIIPIRYFVFQPFVVSGQSMEPNFDNNQYLIIDELSYHFTDPARGQVIVLRPPNEPKQYYIKRIIGLPGEKVQITDDGHVIIYNATNPQGVTLDEPYLSSQTISDPHDRTIVGGKKILTLASDEYFMMGDNRPFSSDSRDWGPLKRDAIVGKVLFRALPLNAAKAYTTTPAYGF
jgi:signal peptidase I